MTFVGLQSLKTYFFVLLLICAIIVAADARASNRPSSLLSQSDIEKVEKQVLAALKGEDISPERLFYLKLIAARELYNYRHDKKSEEYYQKAIAMDVDEDKSEAYINLISISWQREDEAQMRQRILEAQKYYTDNSKYSSQEKSDYLQSLLLYLEGKEQEVSLNSYDMFFTVGNVSRMIQEGDYQKALSQYRAEGLKNADIGTKATFDLLRVLVSGAEVDVESLLCYDIYQKNPHSYSYSMKICAILSEYLEQKSISSEKLDDLEAFLKENYPRLQYLHKAARDLK